LLDGDIKMLDRLPQMSIGPAWRLAVGQSADSENQGSVYSVSRLERLSPEHRLGKLWRSARRMRPKGYKSFIWI